ncbi:flagellar biosynthesis anti-sigma factor FlgM [Candidatus Methylospira mobilis]|uniref:Negative regulator of flagellin synthesis n=1 Tax=Candidatus Methylospira mobilis TaxID=1808979 RepID=A0A5Q0BKY0_9GAMM|nr:flagellar biosynthesis anti-sigma factor FlgM [Candidatus Methylospira mobilis]QFY42426.1 flagellar biosynthesis anti-sigma factor FlgM [Candidatus Methylospira mobilis]WNV04472.1 flagellar biosynthesis anti-sigma factor FlgM [Candidatus Methylospira mobilis]
MKINNEVDISLKQQYSLGKGDAKSGKTGAGSTGSVSGATDSASYVSLSPASQAASTASTSGVHDSQGPFDAKKVEQIKSAIASGQFQVNAGNIADSLITSVHGLLSSGA